MRNVQWTDLPFKLSPIEDITDTLASRPNDPNPYRRTEDITHISIHHSAVEGGTIQGYANHHVKTLKWFHIGYHLVIKGNQTYQVNDLQTFSYHTSGHNHYTVSISVSGDLSKRTLSDVERLNLYGAILTVMDLFKIPVENVLGHNEYPDNATSCPCLDMDKIRADIKTLQLQREYAKSEQFKQTTAFAVANQILYLYNMAKDDPEEGKRIWAMKALLELAPYMRERGLL